MIPAIGRIVQYTLTESDAMQIRLQRGAGVAGNLALADDVYPLIITRVWDEEPDETAYVNGQVLLDGNDVLWVTSVVQGEGPRTWRAPVVKA